MLFSLLADGAQWYPILFDSPLNVLRAVFFWGTVVLAIAFAVAMLLCKFVFRKNCISLAKATVPGWLVWAFLVGISLLSLTFAEDGIVLILFLPLLFLILAVAGAAVTLYFKRGKIVYLICGCLVGAALIATLVCMGIYFTSGDAAESNWITNGDVNRLGLYLSAVLLLALVVGAAFFFGRKDKKGFDTKSIAYAAVCIAMSFALSYLKIVKMPQGGSITVASLLPIMVYSYMFGTKKGVFAGAVYGLLQAIQDPYILHPAQFILDYPAAFAAIGLAGMFARCKKLEKLPQLQIALGGIVAGILRFVMHFISGVFAFGAFAPEGTPVWIYSLGYQAAYVLPDIAIAIAVGIAVFSSRAFLKEARKFHPMEKPVEKETVAP